jgi:bifunctional NMN adenylyltransferase/nudix hydrolase
MTKQYNYAVFIGRFQPFHIGHEQVIKKALEIADKLIIVLGSANSARTPKNPWTASERATMIFSLNFDEGLNRIKIVKVNDNPSDQKWTASVQEAVGQAMFSDSWLDKPNVAIIGHNKDESSFYLKLFPQWTTIDHEMNEVISATDLRELYFEGKNLKFLQSLVPSTVYAMLDTFRKSSEFSTLSKDYEYIKKYKRAWEAAPYPPIFVTVDAVIVQSGHVLMIKRRSSPGAGLEALPGGFVNQFERLEDAMIRELREETGLKVPDPVLRGNIKEVKVFDNPNRSLRGRTITHAFYIELPPGPLPKVKGGDDAAKAMWVPLGNLNGEELFEDHWFIIEYFIGQ